MDIGGCQFILKIATKLHSVQVQAWAYSNSLFGLTRAPKSFYRLMNQLLCWLPFVTVHIDGMLIYLASKKEHVGISVKYLIRSEPFDSHYTYLL